MQPQTLTKLYYNDIITDNLILHVHIITFDQPPETGNKDITKIMTPLFSVVGEPLKSTFIGVVY